MRVLEPLLLCGCLLTLSLLGCSSDPPAKHLDSSENTAGDDTANENADDSTDSDSETTDSETSDSETTDSKTADSETAEQNNPPDSKTPDDSEASPTEPPAPTPLSPAALYERYQHLDQLVAGGQVIPHWMTDGNRFWYAEGAPAATIIYLVDPTAGTREPLFDTDRLRASITTILGHEPPYQGIPFDQFLFTADEQAIQFRLQKKTYQLQLDSYAVTEIAAETVLLGNQDHRQAPTDRRSDAPGNSSPREIVSPDNQWIAFTRNQNIWVRSTRGGNQTMQITTDGNRNNDWTISARQGPGGQWSPNSLQLAVKKVDRRLVPKAPIVHWLTPREDVELVTHRRAGMQWPLHELYVIDILTQEQVKLDTGPAPKSATDAPRITILGWHPNGSELFFLRNQRDFKQTQLMAANTTSGASRVILTETQETFIPYWQQDYCFYPLADGQHFIWGSERDGWNHLYLYDFTGKPIQRLTTGAFPVNEVLAVDPSATGSWVYFTAQCDTARPYDQHLCRVHLDGSGFQQLTEAAGHHDITLAPSRQYFLDSHSTISQPPTVTLKKADGETLQTLSEANITGLEELGWQPPESFQVTATDGETSLHGLIYKPNQFDPEKKYPVLEAIYGGPQLTTVPRTFLANKWEAQAARALAQLGFIVFMVDGPGTPGRGKAFLDFGYGKRGRYEIAEHVHALKQLAAEHPYMDTSRVGVFGHSYGGYMTIRAMLTAGDVYHVGVASAPLVDLDDTVSEYYLGPPQKNKEAYDLSSNTKLASQLQGKLLLVHGTSDRGVPVAATIKLVDALTRAGKPYDLILLPEQDHVFTGISDTYYWEARRKYFQEHLKP